MQIKLNNNIPWFSQLDELKEQLYKVALTQTNGDKKEAARLLGCPIRTLNNKIKNKKDLQEFYKKPTNGKDFKSKFKILLELGFTIGEIAKSFNTSRCRTQSMLSNYYNEDKYLELDRKNRYKKTKDKRMFNNIEDILNNNRIILAEIAEKIRDNKVDELSIEHRTYAKILFNNGFIDSKGQVTDEGKAALYQ